MGTKTAEDFEAVVAEHESAMLRYACYLLGRDYEGRHHDAQDLVQDALLRLHRQWREHGRDSVAHVRTWLLRVTHNLAIDAIRRRGRARVMKRQMEQASVGSGGSGRDDVNGEAGLEMKEAAGYAMRLMSELPENQCRVLLLRVEGMTVRQIAEVVGMSPGNVGYHMNQGLATLARQMKQAGVV